MSRIQNVLAEIARRGRKALIPYICAGDPSPALTVPLMHALVKAGSDIVELGVPAWLAGAVGFGVAWPMVWIGYDMLRDRNLEPYRGRPLLVRTLACAAVYAALWGVKSFVPAEVSGEMWPWVFLGPFFGVAGGLAALAAFDLDWGTAVAHFSLYVIFTALLRWLAGFMPL